MRNVLVVLGESASGKTTFAEYVRIQYGYAVYEVGDYVREAHRTCESKLLLAQFADKYYQQGNLTLFIEKAIKDAQNQSNKKVLFCGLRTEQELSCVRRAYQDCCVIKIHCPTITRRRRYKKGKQDGISLHKRSRIEKNWTSDLPYNVSYDYLIENGGNLDLFYQKIDQIFQSNTEYDHKEEVRHERQEVYWD